MHYYQFNIKEYRKDTGYLSLLEHAIYRSLIDTYYLDELPLCADTAKLMRTHGVKSKDEKRAFDAVLADFFVLTNDGYRHEKCDSVLSQIYDKSAKARASAKARWDKRNANAMRTHTERNANGMLPNNPLPNNPLPKDKTLDQQVDRDEPSGKSKNSVMDEITPLFEAFWSSGIRKVGKKQSLGVFKKLLAKKTEQKEFTDFLINDVKSRLDAGQLGFAEMHPTTYLRNERWEDELPVPSRGEMGDIMKVSDIYNRVLGDVLLENKLPTKEMAENLKFIKLHQERFRVLDEWERFFSYVRGCHFLIGETPAQKSGENNFIANLSWLLKPENFSNCIGGKYESR